MGIRLCNLFQTYSGSRNDSQLRVQNFNNAYIILSTVVVVYVCVVLQLLCSIKINVRYMAEIFRVGHLSVARAFKKEVVSSTNLGVHLLISRSHSKSAYRGSNSTAFAQWTRAESSPPSFEPLS